jgi:hypothetical protein
VQAHGVGQCQEIRWIVVRMGLGHSSIRPTALLVQSFHIPDVDLAVL